MKGNCLFYVIWSCVIGVVPLMICAQSRSGSIVLHGSVSNTVTLALSPNATHVRAELHALENNEVLSVLISSSGVERNIQVPILIRSNVSYRITASVQAQNAVPTELRVLSIEPSGKLVADDAVTGVVMDRRFEMPHAVGSAGDENLSTIDPSIPFTIFSGSRISLGGGLNSPNNALKVILLLCVRTRTETENWTVNLRLQGAGSEKF